MSWNRSDPFEEKRRKLAEQERLLARQMSRLKEEMAQSGQPAPGEVKASEPPVWRLEEDGPTHRAPDPAPVRKRNLGRQRQRDMILFFILIIVFLLVAGIAYYVAYLRPVAPIYGM